MSLLHRVATAVAGAVLAATFFAPSAAVAATTPATEAAKNPVAGQFCADNEHNKYKLNPTTNVWHQCVNNNGWRWKKIDGAPTGGTCIVNGYSEPCVKPSASRSTSPKPSSTGQLPVTSSINGTYVSGLVVGGVVIVLLGATLFFWVPRRRGAHSA